MYCDGEMTEVFGSIDVPRWAWQRQEARSALMSRDIGMLLRFAQAHSGASQSRLAFAIGLSQGRVNEIMNGRRTVTALEVFERVADGLGLPDDARMSLGLAPRDGGRRSTRATYEEIGRIFADQHAAADEIREVAALARRIDVLAVRGLGLVALNDSLLWPALTAGSGRSRVYLLDPECAAARARAGEIGEPPAAFASGIRLSIERLRELAGQACGHMAVYLYDARPVWRVIGLDDTLYVSGFAAWEGHSSTMYKLLPCASGALHRGFCRMLDDLALTSKRIV
jgi:transcriptional regulator with XRE-family HTH domain